MGWENSLFTRAGIALIRRCADTGASVRITGVWTGAGTMAADRLPYAEALTGGTKQQLPVTDVSSDGAWKRLRLQVTADQLEEGYQLRQIGVWARGADTETPVLMFIMQDEEGFAIPSAEEMPWFSLTIAAVLEIDDPGEIIIERECWIVPGDKTVTREKLSDDFWLGGPGYYDEVVMSSGIYPTVLGPDSPHAGERETRYYLAEIPKQTADGKTIPVICEYEAGTSPLVHAANSRTTLTVNSSLEMRAGLPGVISGGEIARENHWTEELAQQYPYVVYVGFDAERNPHEYSMDTTPDTMLNTMLQDGIVDASVAYYRLVRDGEAADVSDIGLSDKQLGPNPRSCMFTRADGTLCFLACDGRDNNNEGLIPSQLSDLMIHFGAVQGRNLDGGGSSSLVFRSVKQNQNIDEEKTADRTVAVTWNVPRRYAYNAAQDAFRQLGREKQNFIEQMMPYFQSNAVTVKGSVSLLDLPDGWCYVNNATDAPTVIDDGFAHCMEKYTPAHLKKVFWYPYAANTIYANSYDGTNWTGWEPIDVTYGFYRAGNRLNVGTDADDIKTHGKRSVANVTDAGQIANLPINRGGALLVDSLTSPNAVRQTFCDTQIMDWSRYFVGNEWNQWLNRTAAQSVKNQGIPSGQSLRITFSGSAMMCLIAVYGQTSDSFGKAVCMVHTSAIRLTDVDVGSNITISQAQTGQSVIVSNNGTSNVTFTVINFGNFRPVITTELLGGGAS